MLRFRSSPRPDRIVPSASTIGNVATAVTRRQNIVVPLAVMLDERCSEMDGSAIPVSVIDMPLDQLCDLRLIEPGQ